MPENKEEKGHLPADQRGSRYYVINYVSGTGLAGTIEEALDNIKNLPIDP